VRKQKRHLILPLLIMFGLLLQGCMNEAVLIDPETGLDDPALIVAEEPEGDATLSAGAVPVLLYHALKPRSEYPQNTNGAVIAVEEFRDQMYWLKEQGYVTPALGDFLSWVKGEGGLPPKSILLTFDDGYRSVRTHAWPILRECGFTAVIFIIGSLVDDATYLAWEDIQEMQGDGIEFQNHTFNGHRGTSSTPEFTTWTREQFAADLMQLEEAFADHSLDKPISYAAPFGVTADYTLEVLQELGYEMAFTTRFGAVFPGDNPFSLKRIIVWPGWTPEQLARQIDRAIATER
jgi:peptidoglycan/xylan/chitin deacetylase (PgdA/CDA1 family)